MTRSTILVLALAPILAAPVYAQGNARADILFESARQKENVQGDLKGAIETYRQILAKHGKDRGVAARAKLLMAECHEKLGQAEARRLYEDLAKNYADQPEAAQARVRLQAIGVGRHGAETSARLVWDQAIDYWGCVNADGRLLSFVDWSTGDLAVRDLRAGQHRRVTNRGGYDKALGEAEASCISPDGKRIAFNWERWDPASKTEGAYQLRIINADGTGDRLLRQPGLEFYIEPYGWSPDGKWLAIVEGKQNSSAIELIAPDTGETRTVLAQGEFWKRAVRFSPDGKWLAYERAPRAYSLSSDVFLIAADGSAKDGTMAAQDARLVGWSPTGKTLILEKDEGGSRKLYWVPVASGRATAEPSILHAPAISGYPGFLGITARGELFYGTNNYRADAWLVRAEGGTGTWSEPLARFPAASIGFANNAGNLRFSPDGKQLAAFVPANSIVIRTVAGGPQRLITPQLKDYRRFEWTPDGKSFLASAAGEDGRHGIHRVDAISGAASYLCGIDRGTVFVPSADGRVVYNLTSQGLAATDLQSCRETRIPTRDFSAQGPQTIKLSRDGKALLLTSFAYIGIYDIAAGSLREIYHRKEQTGVNFWSADWSGDGRHIIATVRPKPREGAAQENNPRECWVFPAEGGTPQISSFPASGRFRNVVASPDGVHLAALQYDNRAQVWVLDNFLPAQ